MLLSISDGFAFRLGEMAANLQVGIVFAIVMFVIVMICWLVDRSR